MYVSIYLVNYYIYWRIIIKTNLKFITATLFGVLTLASPQLAQDSVSGFNHKQVEDVRAQPGILYIASKEKGMSNIIPAKLAPDVAFIKAADFQEINDIDLSSKSHPGILFHASTKNDPAELVHHMTHMRVIHKVLAEELEGIYEEFSSLHEGVKSKYTIKR